MICVASICKDRLARGYVVIAAADRMLTAGDIEFELEQPKIVSLSTSVFGL